MKLPPFSPDYSEVCSAIFDLNCVAVIRDTSSCTGNYTGYDEPRWYESEAAIFYSGLREIGTILGDDEKMVQEIPDAIEGLNPELIVLIGSPAPMVIGTDMKGIAADIEAHTGIPCLGFDTTGTRYYSDGITGACPALTERFTRISEQKIPNGVNLLGLTPPDFGSSAAGGLEAALTQNGLELISSSCDGLTMETVQNATQASLNLVVSQPGLQPARFMEQRFGIPYLVQIPIGRKAQENWLEAVHNCLNEQKSLVPYVADGETDILVLGGEILCRNVQLRLETDSDLTADCGCLFGTESKLSETSILNLEDERKIGEAINCRKYRRIVDGPILRMLIRPETEVDFFDLSSYCISSKMSGMPPVSCIGERFNAFLAEIR